MVFEPYLRSAGDGTLELLIPSADGTVHVLPYCFHTAEDAAIWLATRKGREHIRNIRRRYGKPRPVSGRAGLSAGPTVP